MSTLESQILQSLNGLSDDSLRSISASTQPDTHRLGSMRGQKFIADGHDIDDYDDEIALMFRAVPDA